MTVEEQSGPTPSTGDLHEVMSLLWPTSEITCGRRVSAQGRREAPRSWVCVPSAGRPKLLVPTGGAAGAAVVRGYAEPHSRRARVRRTAVAAAFGSGLAARVLPGRVVVQGSGPGVEDHLSDVLGTACRVGVHVGPPRANRKPVLTLVSEHGGLIGYAKVGINPLTCTLVSAEHRALTTLAHLDLGELHVARVLSYEEWHGLLVLVQAPLPVWRPRAPESELRRTAAMVSLARSARFDDAPLAATPVWRRTRAALSARTGETARCLVEAADALEDRAGALVPVGAWHGDWHDGNVAFLDDRVLLWDLERYEAGVPLGWDRLHQYLQSQARVGGMQPRLAAAALLDRAQDLLAPFGVPSTAARDVGVAYLVCLAVRYLGDDQDGAGSHLGRLDTWLLPALLHGP